MVRSLEMTGVWRVGCGEGGVSGGGWRRVRVPFGLRMRLSAL